MATQFLQASAIRRYAFTQYSSTLSALQTALRADIPALGGSFEVLATTAAPTVAIIVTPNGGPVLTMNSTDWIGYNYGVWEVKTVAQMGRTVADGATNSNTTVTSATAAFNNPLDLGAVIAGPGIPSGATITAVGSSTSVTISAAATATATSQPLTITRASNAYTPDVI